MIAHKCTQAQNIKEIQKDVQISRERDVLQTEQILTMQKDVKEIKETLVDIKTTLNNLDNRYPTRREVQAIAAALGLFATVL
jgi:hypothetical protein